MKNVILSTSVVLFSLLTLTACSGDGGSLTGDPDPNGPGGSGLPGVPGAEAPPPEKVCFDQQQGYVGLGGLALHSSRAEALPGVDRDRFKPFSSLSGEFRRALGTPNAPNLQNSAATFGDAPPRFFAEPKATAVNLFEAYQVAFRLCESTNTTGSFASAPTEAAARTECASWERKAWSRTPTPADIDSCVKIAVTDSITENPPSGQRQTTPVRRWAYACAAVYASAGFLTY